MIASPPSLSLPACTTMPPFYVCCVSSPGPHAYTVGALPIYLSPHICSLRKK